MVTSVTSLTRNGLRDWLVQRVSAVILGFYTFFLLIYFLANPHLTFESWHGLFAHPAIRFFTFLAIVSLVLHAWVGIWTVLTDYVKPFLVRLTLHILMVIALLGYLAWGIVVLWNL